MNFDIELKIEEGHEHTKYFQIYSHIRNLILNGALAGGSKLPSIRALSKD